MRRLLYISPCFPPQTRVGALRPLKFARHLPAHGWRPTILCDLSPEDAIDPALLDHLPPDTPIIRDYSRRASRPRRPYQPPPWKRLLPRALRNEYRSRSFWWPPPEWLPLGHHGSDLPHAIRAGRRALAADDFDAIMVNADPWAALLVGRSLARDSGLPLVLDLRDPWSACELRRHRRPPPQRWLVDRIERACVEPAARVILNTETALADYRAHYADLPAERFDVIRNHADPDLIAAGTYPSQPVFTLLFLGNLRQFVSGDVLLAALGRLRRARGWGPEAVRLMVTGRIPPETRALAARHGVADQLVDHPFVPYREIGAFMRSVDLLVALGNATRQRIPAKIYDYAAAERPMLVVADNPELDGMLSGLDGVAVRRLGDVSGVAAAIERAVDAGRLRCVDRRGAGFDSASATAKLAAILDAAVGR